MILMQDQEKVVEWRKINVCFLLTKASWNEKFNFLKGTIFRFAVQFKKQSLLFEYF